VSLVVVAGGKGAPGATTTALGLASAWTGQRRVVVEADPDGGVLAARLGLGLEPGLVTVAAAARRELSEEDLHRHLQPLDAGLKVLVGPSVPERARAALGVIGGLLAERLGAMGAHAFVDVGRAWPSAPEVAPLFRAADAVVAVCRPRLDELGQLVTRWRTLRAVAPQAGVVLVGEAPYGPADVAEALADGDDSPIWGVLPVDARGADLYSAQRAAWTWQTRRAPLVRALGELSRALAARLTVVAESNGSQAPSQPAEPAPRLGRDVQVAVGGAGEAPGATPDARAQAPLETDRWP